MCLKCLRSLIASGIEIIRGFEFQIEKQSITYVAICDTLGLVAEADTWEELRLMIDEMLDANLRVCKEKYGGYANESRYE